MERPPSHLPTHDTDDGGTLTESIGNRIDRELEQELAAATGGGVHGPDVHEPDGGDTSDGDATERGASEADMVDGPPPVVTRSSLLRPSSDAVLGAGIGTGGASDVPPGPHTEAANRLSEILGKERRRRAAVANEVSTSVRTLSADLAEAKRSLTDAELREETARAEIERLRSDNERLRGRVGGLENDLAESARHVQDLVRWVSEQVDDAAVADDAIVDSVGSGRSRPTGVSSNGVLSSLEAVRGAAFHGRAA